MESIESMARELLEIAANTEHYGIDYHEERLIRESDVLAALIAALTPQWQSIDTSPKDGQHILACDEYAILVTHWMGNGWYEGEDRYEYLYWEPSHWMALPARPEVPNVND